MSRSIFGLRRSSARMSRRRMTQALMCVAVLITPLAANPGAAGASGPTAGILDSFNRPDGPVGSGWTKLGSFTANLVVSGNRVTAVVGGTANFWNAAAYGPDSEAYATVAALPTGDGYFYGLLVRIQNGTSQATRGGYVGRVNVRTANATADDWVIYKTVNGSGTIVSNGGVALPGPKLAVGDKIMTVAYGTVPTTVEVWHFRAAAGSWTRVVSYSDGTNPFTAAGQIGLHLRDNVMAVDDFGGGTTVLVTPTAPANATPPSISGIADQGQTLTAAAGTWTGTPAPSVGRQWQRCDSQGGGCNAIAGATASSYAVGASDVGSTIRVVETATNTVGSVSAASAVTAVATGPTLPANTAAPTISGTPQQGQTLSAAAGSWTGSPVPAVTRQWERCDSLGSACTPLPGATASSYAVTAADVGSTLRVVETATNTVGSVSAAAAVTAVVAGPTPPSNTAVPGISGTPQQGQTLTATAGSWSGTPPLALSEQWETCDGSGANCGPIAGANSASYPLTAAEVGSTVRVVETATNSAGSVSAASAVTAVVLGPTPPSNTTPPAVSGTAQQALTLTAVAGTWSGSPPLALSERWEQCDSGGANCAPIAGANSASYVLTAAEVGSTVRAVETATNSAGSVSAPSAVTAVVVGPTPPSNTAVPTVSGSAQQGRTLTASQGSWSGGPPIALSDQWEQCDSSGANCAAIAGATNASYTLASSDVGSTVRIVVSASNGGGSAQAASAVTAVVTATFAPVSTVAPTISGTTQQGQTLTGTQGTWIGAPTPTITQQWRRCGSSGTGCSPIAGATTLSYQLTSADVGGTLQLLVTGTNFVGSSQAASASTGVIAGPPTSSPVALENKLPGTHAWYPLYSTSTGGALEGYASDTSVAPGESLQFHVSAAAPDNYQIQIYRLGYYNGLGGRLMTCLPSCTTNTIGQKQPYVAPDPVTGLASQNWPVTNSMTVPGTWVSGYYVAKLTLKSGTNVGKSWPVPFVVRQDPNAAPSRMLVVSSVDTEQAYNAWGGKSLYAHNSTGSVPAKMVSFDRPYGNQVLYFELPFLSFIESQPTLDPAYITDVDVDRTPQELLRHRFTMVNGHSEYWSKGTRDAYEAARAAGVNLAFWGGDQGDWQVRYQDNWRTMVGYKTSPDPYPDPSQRTTNFSKLTPPRPQCQLLGTSFQGGSGAIGSYAVNAATLSDRYFAGTGFVAGDTFAGNGFEYDWIGSASCLGYPTTVFFSDASRPNVGPALRYTTPSGSTVFTVASEALAMMLSPQDPRLQRFALNVLQDLSQ
ncbi:MAG: N,N-dimethylformamidase beta subunit family domain-containing protein [Actinomycetota bacterium]